MVMGGHLEVDGIFGPATIKALQTFLSKQHGMCGTFGPRTIKALQTFLNAHWGDAACQDERLPVCGTFGPITVRALQTFLNSRWGEAGWRPEYLTVDDKFGPSTIKALQTYLNRVHASVMSYLTLRSALKRQAGPKHGAGLKSSFTVSGPSSFDSTASTESANSRRCNVLVSGATEQEPPCWYMDYVEALHDSGWQNPEEAEASVAGAGKVERSSSTIGTILGTMLHSGTWYYMLEVENEERGCFEIVMRTHRDFQRLGRALSKCPINDTSCPWSEMFGVRRRLNPDAFFEKQQHKLQRYLDSIAANRALATDPVVTYFIRNQYLKAPPPFSLRRFFEEDSDFNL